MKLYNVLSTYQMQTSNLGLDFEKRKYWVIVLLSFAGGGGVGREGGLFNVEM